ncbi:MAG TPA: lysine--tRNA ligase [Candidatus Absconditabacterales bacterium]|nr:lysine--tRNA ligase [Candidatus Absconditabacterales bacterium]
MTETTTHEEHQNERDVRINKVKKMKNIGIIPYAQSFDKKNLIGDIIQTYETKEHRDIIDIIPNPEIQVKTAGRVMLYRSHGKLAFAKLLDSSAEIQLMFHRDNCKIITDNEGSITNLKDGSEEGMSAYKFMEKMVDMGDFIGVEGEIFKTHKGELTIFVSAFKFLSKSIRPLPEKFHGLQDQEELYRKRYLDLTMNPETYKRFLLKSKMYQSLREFYTKEGFTEIQTNILGNSASGAAARPFITHHNDYDTDVFLRIAFETGLKKATVGRFEKVFEIGQDFRNEGSDPSHLQEFTQVEHYAVYRNYEDNMTFTEKMFDYLFESLGLSKKLNIKDKDENSQEVDFTTPRKRIDFTKGIQEASGIDITKYGMDDADSLRNEIKSKGIEFEKMEKMGTTTLIDYLYKKVLRPKIIGPAFIYNYPVIMQPLARISDKDTNIVEQFQLLVNGREICKAYSELVDPILQQENFDKQAKAAEAGDEEATASDDDFVTAMEYGMPPQSGFGMGLERLLAILTEQDNLRDVVMFPLMKAEKKVELEDTSEVDIATLYGTLPAREDVENLAKKYIKDTYRHCIDVATVMKHFAKKLKQNEELRYIAGLLHDIDRDYIGKDPSKHLGEEFEKIVAEINLPQCLVDDIKSHYTSKTSVAVNSLLRKYLISVDELTGFIYAVGLMRPTGLEGMEYSSVKKKLKDKKFAAGVDREEVLNCEKYLAIPLDEFVPEVIKALQV